MKYCGHHASGFDPANPADPFTPPLTDEDEEPTITVLELTLTEVAVIIIASFALSLVSVTLGSHL